MCGGQLLRQGLSLVLVWALIVLHSAAASCLSWGWQCPVLESGSFPWPWVPLSIIPGTGQFLKSLADVLGDSLCICSTQLFLRAGKQLRGEVGPFLQVETWFRKT